MLILKSSNLAALVIFGQSEVVGGAGEVAFGGADATAIAIAIGKSPSQVRYPGQLNRRAKKDRSIRQVRLGGRYSSHGLLIEP